MSGISKDELLDFVRKNIRKVYASTKGRTFDSFDASAKTFTLTVRLLAEHQGLTGFKDDLNECLKEIIEDVAKGHPHEPSQTVGYETPEGEFFCLACADEEVLGVPGARPVLLSGAQSWAHACSFCGKRLDGRTSKG